jgi:light-regulated signal transduction histidine kinase (bacteriophytochrome)
LALPLDLTNCDREPIHIPGSIQPCGILLALEGEDLRVLQASANLPEFLDVPAGGAIGRPLAQLHPEAAWGELAAAIRAHAPSNSPVVVRTTFVNGHRVRALVHRSPEALILELEPADSEREVTFPDLYPLVWSFIGRLQDLVSVEDLTNFAASEVRRVTGFDRVLIYQFDDDWNGTVVAEDRNDNLPSYLDLRFPASDIPAQARALYRLNRIRLISDAAYTPVPLEPATSPPLDLSHSVLRSVSPVHLEYMRNMGTAASMSISILREGQLWGLISCHHATPRHVGFDIRTACDLIGQVFSLQLAARERSAHFEGLLELRRVNARLLDEMAERENFVEGLTGRPDQLLGVCRAHGASVVFGGTCHLVGETPDETAVRAIVDFLSDNGMPDVWQTDSLAEHLPRSGMFADVASGLLAASISRLHRSYVLWFRPEVVRNVKWGGDPNKPAEASTGTSRLHPRKSFEMWRETVRGRSLPWKLTEVEAVAELRHSIVAIVLRNAEELAEISAELERSNKELEAFSYSVSHDLRAPFRHIVGYAELLKDLESDSLSETGRRYIDTIIESAHYAGTLVDNLLTFSQIGRSSMNRVTVDMNNLVRDVQARLAPDFDGRSIRFDVSQLEPVEGDPMLLRLAMENLLSNAIKYTRSRANAVVEIGSMTSPAEVCFFVRDNGVGFDMKYYDKLFGVFQRLHRMEDFEGTGIGLANVRRIIARHGGRTWAEGAVDQGATFWFALPKRHGDTAN